MIPELHKDARGVWHVRYGDDSYVGTYQADSEADAHDFANSPARQAEHRAFGVVLFKAKHGLS